MSDFPSLGSDVWNTKAISEVRDHFNDQQPRFVYEDVAGQGSFGMTYRVREKLPDGGTRRLAVKRALDGEEDVLRNEIRWLEELAGSAHIVRIVASHDGVKKQGKIARWARRLSLRTSRGSSDIKESLEGLKGPVLMMEYLDNGDLAQLYYRTIKYGLVVPNKVLWSIFLCLVRACVAMAYPGRTDENAGPRLEEVPDDRTTHLNLDHGDLHMGNGDIASPSNSEHELVPVLKLIDFGQANENEDAVQENLFNTSKIMINLIARQVVQVQKTATDYNGFRTYATEILPPPLQSEGGASYYKYADLDPELRDLVARCLAQDPSERPGLAEMLRTIQPAAAGKTATAMAASSSPPGGSSNANETDDAIRAFLQKALYDAEGDVSGKREARDDLLGGVADFGF
ncbi:SURF1 family-domain-containing protein [Apiospora arundinis]